MTNDTRVRCQTCDAAIGEYIHAGDRVSLLIGNARLRDAWGWCNQCGAEWNWHESDQQMDRLLQRLSTINS